MQLTVFAAALLASVVSARSFTLYDDVNFGGVAHAENRNNDAACCMLIIQPLAQKESVTKQMPGNLNGAGDGASSVRGDSGCTTFFQ